MELKIVADAAAAAALFHHGPGDILRVGPSDEFTYDATSMAVHDGINVIRPNDRRAKQPGRWLRRKLTGDDLLGVLQDSGEMGFATLVTDADLADGETLVINDETFEFDELDTEAVEAADNGDFDSEDSPLVVAGAVASYPSITFAEGKLIQIEDEILRVTAVSGGNVTFARGQSGTSVAAHADDAAIFHGDGVTLGSIAVGLPDEYDGGPRVPSFGLWALEADVTALSAVCSASVVSILAEDAGGTLFIHAKEVGPLGIELSTTIAGGTNKLVDQLGQDNPAPILNGRAVESTKTSLCYRSVSEAEIAAGEMHFAIPFDPQAVVFSRLTNASLLGQHKDWDGQFILGAKRLTLKDNGEANWESGDFVSVLVTDSGR